MNAWQRDFIKGIIAGKPEAHLAKTLAGLPLAVVQGLREEDEEFGLAWDAAIREAESRASRRYLTPQALERVMNAQVSDERASAYFGLSVKEYIQAISADPALSKVYTFGRGAGQAIAELNTYDEMLNGNWQAAQHFVRHKLGQMDDIAALSGPTVINFNMLDPGASYRQLLGGGTLGLDDVIEGEVVHAEAE